MNNCVTACFIICWTATPVNTWHKTVYFFVFPFDLCIGECDIWQQGWVENSTPGIYRWNLPVFPGMANKAHVANNGKYNFFAAT